MRYLWGTGRGVMRMIFLLFLSVPALAENYSYSGRVWWGSPSHESCRGYQQNPLYRIDLNSDQPDSGALHFSLNTDPKGTQHLGGISLLIRRTGEEAIRGEIDTDSVRINLHGTFNRDSLLAQVSVVIKNDRGEPICQIGGRYNGLRNPPIDQ